jgi:hypothetical protein
MDQVALFTAILLMSILGQSANTDQHKNLVAEIPFNQGDRRFCARSKLESCGRRGMPL